jgi:hypothetical protein
MPTAQGLEALNCLGAAVPPLAARGVVLPGLGQTNSAIGPHSLRSEMTHTSGLLCANAVCSLSAVYPSLMGLGDVLNRA